MQCLVSSISSAANGRATLHLLKWNAGDGGAINSEIAPTIGELGYSALNNAGRPKVRKMEIECRLLRMPHPACGRLAVVAV